MRAIALFLVFSAPFCLIYMAVMAGRYVAGQVELIDVFAPGIILWPVSLLFFTFLGTAEILDFLRRRSGR